MSNAPDCDVCAGLGTYPIYGQDGGYRYDIKCPECMGLGTRLDDPTIAQGRPQAAPHDEQPSLPWD